MTSAPTYELSWKGQTSGPFRAEEIRAMLNRGEISLMHQVYAKGRWMPLEEFFSAEDDQKKLAEQQRQRAREAEQRRIEEQRRAEQQAAEAENKRRLLRVEEELRKTKQQPNPSFVPGTVQTSAGLAPQRTSGLALAALIMGLMNFVPGPNLVSWILAIIFGHVALSKISKDPTLGGRGMALAGLCITYALIAIGVLVGLTIGILDAHK
jgi:hypothetical protein